MAIKIKYSIYDPQISQNVVTFYGDTLLCSLFHRLPALFKSTIMLQTPSSRLKISRTFTWSCQKIARTFTFVDIASLCTMVEKQQIFVTLRFLEIGRYYVQILSKLVQTKISMKFEPMSYGRNQNICYNY